MSCRDWDWQHLLVLVHLVDRTRAEKPVREARGVGHQLAHGRGMDRVFQDHLAALIHALKNFQMGELRDVLSTPDPKDATYLPQRESSWQRQ